MQAAVRDVGAPVTVDTLYPPSDHLSFRPTSTQSCAVSILSGEDITKVLGMLRSGAPPAGEPPPIFQILHSEADAMDKLDAAAVARGVRWSKRRFAPSMRDHRAERRLLRNHLDHGQVQLQQLLAYT